MLKPNNYDNTQASGEYIPIELGGHTAIVKRVEETTSKTGKPMLKVAIDFDAVDQQPGYFMKSFETDTRDNKTWPYQAMQYILTEDQNRNCSRALKTFISCVEKSNNAECVWGDGFEGWFKNKKIGVVYGEVEEEYNGEVKTRRKIRYFCQYDKAATATVPDKKYLDTINGATKQSGAAVSDDLAGFVRVPAGADDEIPF